MRLKSRSFIARLPALVLVSLVLLFVGFLVIRSATVNSFSRSLPMVAARMAPDDPRVIAGRVDLDLRTRMGMARASTKRKARQALVKAPLMEEPFVLEGIDRLLAKDNRRAGALIGHALARNGRSRLARLFRLELELRAGDAEAAAADMTILSRLMPDVQRVFVPELARLARQRETRPALRQALKSDPHMLGNVLQNLAAKGADPGIVLSLAGNEGLAAVDENGTDWRRTLLDSMVKKGDVRRARLLWSRFSGIDPEEAESYIYDGSFEGLPGLPPFNWSLASSEMGAAERDKSGALFVEYYGRTAGELASQLITLPPGRYRIAFHAEGDLDDPQHRLIWKVECRGNDRELLELPIANVTYAGRVLAAGFAVPADCPAQWLKLVGEPTEFPKIVNVLIRQIRIERIGAR